MYCVIFIRNIHIQNKNETKVREKKYKKQVCVCVTGGPNAHHSCEVTLQPQTLTLLPAL